MAAPGLHHGSFGFMEYLVQAGMAASNIANYITAIRPMLKVYGYNTVPFRDHRLKLYVKAIRNRSLQPFIIQ